ncbi:hypothetical protein APY03_5641 [Variovorax sp. WDL1]|nr:hypothetical protein APY03_5641 [Variovorax sp. WDL1]
MVFGEKGIVQEMHGCLLGGWLAIGCDGGTDLWRDGAVALGVSRL